jgi:hypothetical protein
MIEWFIVSYDNFPPRLQRWGFQIFFYFQESFQPGADVEKGVFADSTEIEMEV